MFGWSVSISGDYTIIGAPHNDDNGTSSGSAYIFRKDGANWVEEQKFLASDAAEGDIFGISSSISGDYAIVGASENDDNGTSSGSAYIFKRDGMNWIEEKKFTASDGAEGELFGTSVAISGDYAIVGASKDDDNGTFSGSAYIFRRDGVNWIEEKKLIASDGALDALFGYSVSISRDYVIVGAYGDDGNGSAYIFRRDGANWIEEQKLLASDGALGDQFGYSTSISGDYTIVSAPKDNLESGSAYIYSNFIVGMADEQSKSPNTYRLYQNYPNPFNPSTKIKYQIPELSFVTLKVYDVLGRAVTTLINEAKQIGSYEVEFSTSELSSGIYFYRIQAGDFVRTKKMTLLK